MEIIVVGAGVGGLALANALGAAGHRVRVLERAAGPREGGAAVTVFSNGKAAAAGLGVPVDGLGGRIDELEIRDPADRRIGRTDLRVMARRTGFAVETVPRSALLRRFAEGVEVRYGHEVVAVDRDGTVTDGAGRRHPADVVVGADGYRSAVRRAVLTGTPGAASTGWTSWQGLSHVLPALAGGTHARCYVGPAGLCGLMPAGGGLLQWWFDAEGGPPDGQPVTAWLTRRFAGYAAPVAELLATLDPADVQAYPHVLHEVPDAWGSGPVTLLGDAAHAFPPSQAQGANQALEDAWLLARALGTPGAPVADLLRRYERTRARRVRRVSRLAASEVTNRPPNAAGRLAGRLLTPALAGRAYLGLIRRFSSVLNDDRV